MENVLFGNEGDFNFNCESVNMASYTWNNSRSLWRHNEPSFKHFLVHGQWWIFIRSRSIKDGLGKEGSRLVVGIGKVNYNSVHPRTRNQCSKWSMSRFVAFEQFN